MTTHRPVALNTAKPRKRERLCAEIADYLRAHPNAGDTAKGVSAWWLAEQDDDGLEGEVEEALEYLVRQGLAARKVLCDGTVLYQATDSGPG